MKYLFGSGLSLLAIRNPRIEQVIIPNVDGSGKDEDINGLFQGSLDKDTRMNLQFPCAHPPQATQTESRV